MKGRSPPGVGDGNGGGQGGVDGPDDRKGQSPPGGGVEGKLVGPVGGDGGGIEFGGPAPNPLSSSTSSRAVVLSPERGGRRRPPSAPIPSQQQLHGL